jgi:arginine utilization protein RocB
MSKVINVPELDEDEVQAIYEWIDEIPLSRPKRNITRDFADGAMLAEVIKHYHPRLVELHNYPLAHNTQQKTNNWNILNTKVFKRMGFQISRADVDRIINSAPQAIERVLAVVKQRIEEYKETRTEEQPVVEEKPQPVGKKPKLPENKVTVQNSALKEKEQIIQELKETIEIMENKINKLEQLVKLKDSKIQILNNKLAAAGIS